MAVLVNEITQGKQRNEEKMFIEGALETPTLNWVGESWLLEKCMEPVFLPFALKAQEQWVMWSSKGVSLPQREREYKGERAGN